MNQWGKLLTSMIKTLLQTDSDYVSFDCACGTMARVWIRKFWSKVDGPGTGGCQVFGNERSKWEQNWIFGARREQERKFN